MNKQPVRAHVPVSHQQLKAATLRKSGLLLRQIAEEMGLTHQRVWQLIRQYFEKTGDKSVLTYPVRSTDEERLKKRRERHRRAVRCYAQRHPERVAARRKAWEEKNKEVRKTYNRNWKAKNPERHAATYRAWFSDPATRLANLVYNRVADAARRGIVCDQIALRDLAATLPTKCALCLYELDYAAGNGKRPKGPSIDRVDTTLGYVAGNIAVLCNTCNVLKGGGTAEFHRRVATFIESFVEGRCSPQQT